MWKSTELKTLTVFLSKKAVRVSFYMVLLFSQKQINSINHWNRIWLQWMKTGVSELRQSLCKYQQLSRNVCPLGSPFSWAPEHRTIQLPSGDRMSAGEHLSRTEHQYTAGLREALHLCLWYPVSELSQLYSNATVNHHKQTQHWQGPLCVKKSWYWGCVRGRGLTISLWIVTDCMCEPNIELSKEN